MAKTKGNKIRGAGKRTKSGKFATKSAPGKSNSKKG